MSTPALVSLREARFAFRDRILLQNATFHIYPGDRVCLVGKNGTGKSTLMRLLDGQFVLDDGDFFLSPRTIVTFLPQATDPPPEQTVEEFVLSGLAHEAHLLDVPLSSLRYRLEPFISPLGLALEKSAAELSGGEIRRATLARAFITDANLFLLDEPTNHLDIAAIQWLEDWIKENTKATFLIISHDRSFLNAVTRRVLWLERGIVRSCPKSFKEFDAWCEETLAFEAKALEAVDKKLAEETWWLQHGVTARRRRNQGRLRNLLSLREKRASYLAALQHKSISPRQIKLDPTIQQLIVVEKLSGGHPGGLPLFSNLSFRILKGDRMGIIGPNGCGKTTLIDTLMGKLAPLSGQIRFEAAQDVEIFYQNQPIDDVTKTPWEFLCPEGGDHIMVQGSSRHVVAYLKDFLFTPEQAKFPIQVLSGGEKNRLRLAKILARPAKLLILDEPTNDLDVETLDMLQEFLATYPGTVLVVSHDRDFLDNVATSLLVFEAPGKIREFVGNASDYYAEHKAKTFLESIKPAKRALKSKSGTVRERAPRLSYHEVRLLEVLPEQIKSWEVKIRALEDALIEAGSDVEAIAELGLSIEALRAKITVAETEWLILLQKEQALSQTE